MTAKGPMETETQRSAPFVTTVAPPPPGPKPSVTPGLQIAGLNLFYGDFHAVKDVTVTIHKNRVTALIGSSGCGKSTFLRSLNRMHELVAGATVQGDVVVDDQNI